MGEVLCQKPFGMRLPGMTEPYCKVFGVKRMRCGVSCMRREFHSSVQSDHGSVTGQVLDVTAATYHTSHIRR